MPGLNAGCELIMSTLRQNCYDNKLKIKIIMDCMI